MASKKNSDRLLSFITRIERLDEEKRAIATDIASIYQEAKSAGFDPKIMRAMVRERRMSDEARREEQVLMDIYRAALGMLDGTPLGDAARRRMSSKPDTEQPPAEGSAPAPDTPPDMPAEPEADTPPVASPEDLLKAKAEGAAAVKAGKRVTDNPYTAGDARRGAWDEGWCAASASDGMDVPPAWRRSKPAKGAPPAPPGGGA